jgi:hypothetical protein
MQTTKSYTERTQFLTALLRRSAETALGSEGTTAGEVAAYSLGYILGVIAGNPTIYESVLEELGSLSHDVRQ